MLRTFHDLELSCLPVDSLRSPLRRVTALKQLEDLPLDETLRFDERPNDRVPVDEDLSLDETPCSDELPTDRVPVDKDLSLDETPCFDELPTDRVPVDEAHGPLERQRANS